VSENEPTSWLGIWERIAIEGAFLWQAVFAAALIRAAPSNQADVGGS
jgi:hypothetical protein